MINSSDFRTLTNTDLEQYKYNSDLSGFFIQYNSESSLLKLSSLSFASVLPLDKNYAIIYLPFNKIIEVIPLVKDVTPISSPLIYTATDITPTEASAAPMFNDNPYLTLTGKDTIIGIIDSGIDYLNEEFINADNTTKILTLWDQSIQSDKLIYNLRLGSEYTESQINSALTLKSNNGDPYSIVPSKDTIGHGTSMASISAAIGKNPILKGVAPNASLAVVKLKEATTPFLDLAGLPSDSTGKYLTIDIIIAIRYLTSFALEKKKPLVILLPLGSNLGNHDGTSSLETYIDQLVSNLIGITIVVGTGNEGDTDTHTMGKISKSGQTSTQELKISPKESSLAFQIICTAPDIISLDITSPSGETHKTFATINSSSSNITFFYEGSSFQIIYNNPDIASGTETIYVLGRKLKPGIWKLHLIGNYIVNGNYDIWLPQRQLLEAETKFLSSVSNITLTTPSCCKNAIVTGWFNQIKNSALSSSGKGYTRTGDIKPDIVTGGINAPVPGIFGKPKLISGSSVATAVVAGCCALILQWAITDGNEPIIYNNTIKNYIIRGAKKRSGDVYPNIDWGYGILDMSGAMKSTISNNEVNQYFNSLNNNFFDYTSESKEICGFIIQLSSDENQKKLITLNYVTLTPISSNYAIAYFPFDKISEVSKYVAKIIEPILPSIYTPSSITPSEASGSNFLNTDPYLNLNGDGVIIGIIDSGIDYLSPEFINPDKTSKILSIWDQTIEPSTLVNGLNLGREYSNSQITDAIKLNESNLDPYTLVPSKDTTGHGTIMASIASAIGKNPILHGVAPKASLAVVKLKEATKTFLQLSGISADSTSKYLTTEILVALKYLSDLSSTLNKPMVILLPVESNLSSHDGTDPIESYINTLSSQVGLCVVVGTGNEGNTQTCSSGIITNSTLSSTIELNVAPNQNDLGFIIVFDSLNSFSLSIVSPGGEKLNTYPFKVKSRSDIKFNYENTRFSILYQTPAGGSGDSIVSIRASNLKPGIWRLVLNGNYIADGAYWCWLPQRILMEPETKFLNASSNCTLTSPGTASSALVTSWYNQTNNNISIQSGRGFTRTKEVLPIITTGGINALAITPSGITQNFSGSSVAVAVLAGSCALIFQWAIIYNNDPLLYTIELKTNIIRNSKKRSGDTYPNAEWGYGMLDLKDFINSSPSYLLDRFIEYSRGDNLFIRIPFCKY